MTAILKITDGTNTVNLISPNTGFHLYDWTPQSADYKTGGVYQDSPLAHGKALVLKKWDNVIETFDVKLNGYSQDAMIQQTRLLRQLLEKASDYWTSGFATEPVWIEARASKETNTRYAHIVKGRLVSDDNPYAMPFLQPGCRAVMDELQLVIERGHWRANAPGTGECQELNGTQDVLIESEYVTNTTDPVGNVLDIMQASSGNIWAADNGQALVSTDDGASWAVGTTDPVGYVNVIFEAANGDLYIGEEDYIWRSTDGGINWNDVLAEEIIDIDQDVNGYIWAVAFNGTVNRTLNGTDWTTVTTLTYAPLPSVHCRPNGEIVIGGRDRIFRALDSSGSYWYSSPIPAGYVYTIQELSDGELYAGTTYGLYKITDAAPGNKFMQYELINNTVTRIRKLRETPEKDKIYATSSTTVGGGVYVSQDYGHYFKVDGNANAACIGLCITDDGSVYAGPGGATTTIIKKTVSSMEIGQENSCNNVFVANKDTNGTNITHIFINDGGSYSANLLSATLPFKLLPDVPAANDEIVFGISTENVNYSPFSNLIFDIGTIASSTVSYTITWYYSSADVSGWTAFGTAIQDNTSSFATPSVNSVVWTQPTDWIATTVNSIEAFWVKATLTALTGTLTPPTQQNTEIYSSTWGSVTIDEDYILGDIPCPIKISVINKSDNDGSGGDPPDLYTNKVVMGLRSTSRGSNFNAYLNAAEDPHLPFGVSTTAGTDSAFATYSEAPVGQRLVFDPDGVETMANIITWTLSATVARDYYGVYHAFMRGRQINGSANDIGVRLQVTTGTGGITFTSNTKYFTTTNADQIIDLGRVTLPVADLIQQNNIADETSITIQASCSLATANAVSLTMAVVDLVLIPTDEWAGEFTDNANTAYSLLTGNYTLEVDSLYNPKTTIMSLSKNATGLVTSIWQCNANGPAMLQSNAQQKLWMLTMRTASASSSEWRSDPEALHEIRIFKNEQYLGLRGSG